MLILGLSDLGHSATVALLSDGRPIAAVEEEKLNRGCAYDGLPRLALEYCLHEAGARPADIGAVALTGRPKHAWFREERLRFDLLASRAGIDEHAWTAGAVVGKLKRTQMLRHVLGTRVPFYRFEHHLCHASSAFFASAFDRALVFTLDGSGDMWSGLLSLGEGESVKPLHSLRFPNSLGWLYTGVTELLGFRARKDEQKTQWLSAGGPPDFLPSFRRLFRKDDRGLPVLDRRFLTANAAGAWKLSPGFTAQLELSDGVVPALSLQSAIARSVQAFLEETVIDIAEAYRLRTGARHLCVAGGVFLNVLLVRALEQRTGFDRVFVQPVADNAGTALGAGWLAARRLVTPFQRVPLEHLHFGPRFDPHDIKTVLDSCKLTYSYLARDEELFGAVVAQLTQGRMVAWYQERMEFGFRALGNRTIAASPFSPYVTENLNHYLKRREDFHPFVLSIPAERAADFVDASENCRFAASVGELRPGHGELERFAFDGRRVRLHLVENSVNPLFHELLVQFGRQAPAPVLVNTSFNLFGEPLVCDPRTAVRSFYCSGIDALVMDRFMVVK
jgi:carbamoyltransferase